MMKIRLRNWDCLIKVEMKIFKDRKSAGILLAKHLQHYIGQQNIIVLGIPRGGVVTAHEVAKSLKLPLDIVVTRKIGAPAQPELALGAVDADGSVVWEEHLLDDLRLKIDDLRDKVLHEVEEIKRREKVYRQSKKPLQLAGKTVILVDDGIATGSTMLSAINYLRQHQVKKIILASPVAGKDTAEKLSQIVGELIILETPIQFSAVGQFYHQFEPVEDNEVIEYLKYGR